MSKVEFAQNWNTVMGNMIPGWYHLDSKGTHKRQELWIFRRHLKKVAGITRGWTKAFWNKKNWPHIFLHWYGRQWLILREPNIVMAPSVTDGWVRVSGYWLGRRKWKRCFRWALTPGRPQTSHIGHGQWKMWLCWVHFWLVWGPEGGPKGHRWLS